MDGRSRKPYPQIAGARIKADLLRKRLEDHALGKCEMSATQVTAARALLAKVLPDLKAIEHSGEMTQNVNSTLYVPKKDG